MIIIRVRNGPQFGVRDLYPVYYLYQLTVHYENYSSRLQHQNDRRMGIIL